MSMAVLKWAEAGGLAPAKTVLQGGISLIVGLK